MAMTQDKVARFAEGSIKEAERNLAEAESNLVAGSYNVASSQSYYSMFAAASALLLTRGVNVRKLADPEAVASFAYHFVPPGAMEVQYRRHFQNAFKARIACGYDSRHSEKARDAQAHVENAREFLAAARTQLGKELKRLEGVSLRKGAQGDATSNV